MGCHPTWFSNLQQPALNMAINDMKRVQIVKELADWWFIAVKSDSGGPPDLRNGLINGIRTHNYHIQINECLREHDIATPGRTAKSISRPTDAEALHQKATRV